jgi:hypothetical protein
MGGRGGQIFAGLAKDLQIFPRKIQIFPSFSKQFQIYSLAVSKEIKELQAVPSSRAKRSDPDFGLRRRLSLDRLAVARNDGCDGSP